MGMAFYTLLLFLSVFILDEIYFFFIVNLHEYPMGFEPHPLPIPVRGGIAILTRAYWQITNSFNISRNLLEL